MSTHLPGQGLHHQSPASYSELLDYFHAGAKPSQEWRVGAEFEKFLLVRESGYCVQYDEPEGIRHILEQLVNRFHWEPHYAGQSLMTLTRDGAAISLEPGCQVEYSSRPVKHLSELRQALLDHRDEVRQVCSSKHIWIAAGVAPISRVTDYPEPLRPRHQLMAELMPRRGPMALQMMYTTASTQVTFDYADESDAICKFTTALRLSPLVNAIWANSPMSEGRLTGWRSYRANIWRGMDSDRSGWFPRFLQGHPTFASWTEQMLDVPMLFVVKEGQYHPPMGRTFRDFFEHGIDGRFPTVADWELHLSSVFPEVRLKHFLEIRGADAAPVECALLVPAFWKGLLYQEDALRAAQELASLFAPEELSHIAADLAEHGLDQVSHGVRFRKLADELIKLACDSLRMQGEDQAHEQLDRFRREVLPHQQPTSDWRSWEF